MNGLGFRVEGLGFRVETGFSRSHNSLVLSREWGHGSL